MTATSTAHVAATETSTAATGGPHARISVIALHARRSAISNTTENVAAGWRTFRDSSIAHPFSPGLRVAASRLCLSGRATCLEILPHGASITASHGGVCIGNAFPMCGIVCPRARSTQAGAASGIEVVSMNETVIDHNVVAAPTWVPAPSAPASPTAAKIKAHLMPIPKP